MKERGLQTQTATEKENRNITDEAYSSLALCLCNYLDIVMVKRGLFGPTLIHHPLYFADQ